MVVALIIDGWWRVEGMRGEDRDTGSMFSYVSPERRVPKDHPLRPIREMVDGALKELSPRFEAIYSQVGRPSIPPEKLLRALLLQIFYTIRSERLLMEQLDYNLLFRWFVGLEMDDAVWDATVFTKNRQRLLDGEIAEELFNRVLSQARVKKLLSDEHFSVDGTLIEAWASQKSFRPKDGDGATGAGMDSGRNAETDFHGHKRQNDTHESTSDPEARLYKKSKGAEAKLAFLGHILMENRNGLVVNARLTEASGYAEREAALEMIADLPESGRITLGADRGFDEEGFIDALRASGITPHVSQKTTTALDGRTTRHRGYELSLRVRKRIEEIFGWMKTIGVMRKTRHRGKRRVGWMFTLTAAAYNLIRMRNLALAAV
jgi:transposase